MTDLNDIGRRLGQLVGAVIERLSAREEAGQELDQVLDQVTDACSYLKEQIEASTVAKAGLEGLLEIYETRYGEQADRYEDVSRFQDILAEKNKKLRFLESELKSQAGRLDEVDRGLEERTEATLAYLADLDEALAVVKQAREAELDRLTQDKNRLEAVVELFWPPQEPEPDAASGPPVGGLGLDQADPGTSVDRVLARLAPDEPQRRELLQKVYESIDSPQAKAALAKRTGLAD